MSFHESFENSSKQQQRRQKRLAAMRRMQEAADNSNTKNPVVKEDELSIITFDDLPRSLLVNSSSTDNNGNQQAYTTASSSASVTSASKFLRETQQQHEREHPTSGTSANPPSLTQALKYEHEQTLAHHSSASNSNSSSTSAHCMHNTSTKYETNGAKQFLWDDSSMISGYTQRSSRVNLHDIKHSFHNDEDATIGRVDTRGVPQSVQSIGAGLLNAIPKWGREKAATATNTAAAAASDEQSIASTGTRLSSRHRDEEGARLLVMASDRLQQQQQRRRITLEASNTSSPQEADDYSFQPNNTIKGLSSINADEEEASNMQESMMEDIHDDQDSFMQGHSRVFLDAQGELSHDAAGAAADSSIHSRRMVNSYKRALRRPCGLVCALAALVGIAVGVASVYSNTNNKVSGIVGSGNHGDAKDEHDAAPAVDAADAVEYEDPYFTSHWGESLDSSDVTATATAASSNAINDTPQDEQTYETAVIQGEQAIPPAQGASHAFDKARFSHLRYTLVQAKASPASVFLDTQSPQFAALVWLTRDDARQLDPNSAHVVQRYGLAVLWFGTTKSSVYEAKSVEIGLPTDKNRGDATDAVASHTDKWYRHDHWLSSQGICGWEGISCHPHGADGSAGVHDGSNDGDVSHVELRKNNLHGVMPQELYTTLPYIRLLDLSDNALVGTLSGYDGYTNWWALETLNLASNNIGGSLTSMMKLTSMRNATQSAWSSLQHLHLANNLLVESIPHDIGSVMRNLRHLDLSGNELIGTIPYEIGELKELSTLDLSSNLLVGPMPHEVSGLQTLVKLDVGHNQLGGPMIMELGHVKYLTVLRLNDNHFSGEVPVEIGLLLHLDELHLNNNDFRGTLPPEISNLESLDSLNLANNHFEGEFPPEYTSMGGLQILDISSNEMIGEIPIFIDGMTNLRSLNMAHNDFSNSIPSELGSLYKLEYLFLEGNEFEDNVPTELGQLSNLKKLALHNNFLNGEVDEHICKLVEDLFLTQLSADCGGEIPEIVCECCICNDHEPIVHLNDEP